MLVGSALAPFLDQVRIATKFRFDIDTETSKQQRHNSRVEHVSRVVDGMLQRLGTDHIEMLRQNKADPAVPIDSATIVRDRFPSS